MELSIARFLDIPGIKDILKKPDEIEVVHDYADHLSFTIGETVGTKTWSQLVSIYEDFVVIETTQNTTELDYNMMLVDYSGQKLINISGFDIVLAKEGEDPFIVFKKTEMLKLEITKGVGMFGISTFHINVEESQLPKYARNTYYVVDYHVKMQYPERWDFMCALSGAEDSNGNKIVRHFY